MSKQYYITTTLPYVNSTPHIGFAMELVRADVLTRFLRSKGNDVFLNTGTDEHGKKIYESATEKGIHPQEYTDTMAGIFKSLNTQLGIVDDIHFIRTTDHGHIAGAQALWNRVAERGFIYKGTYKSKYCVGCELEKTDSDLVNGRCSLHPNREIELIEEENYFFAFSKLQQALLAYYADHADFVLPEFRFNELRSFVERGLTDFSISRMASKLSWGIPVPGDPAQVMYVWFDALANYITTLGWPTGNDYARFWESGYRIQVCGQDNLRQQGAMWQAMLLAAGLPLTNTIYINGFVVGEDGQKMSKSLGNTIDPRDVVTKYGTDAARYLLLRHVHPFDGSPISDNILLQNYNAHLVNGLGNVVSRILAMSEKHERTIRIDTDQSYTSDFAMHIENYRFDMATDYVWAMIGELDRHIATEKPFSVIKTDVEKGIHMLDAYMQSLYTIAAHLVVLLPTTATEIMRLVLANKKPEKPLFPRV